MTGKALVPVVHDGGDRWHGTLQEQRRDLAGDDEVVAFEDDVMRRGYYPFRATPDEVNELEWERADLHSPRVRYTSGRGSSRAVGGGTVRVPPQPHRYGVVVVSDGTRQAASSRAAV